MTPIRHRKILGILLACLASTRICWGGFETDVSQLCALHEKLVFTHEARALTGKYLTKGIDPNSEKSFSQPAGGPFDRQDERIRKCGEEFLAILRRMKEDGVIFDMVRDSLPAHTLRGLAVDILITDHLWPTKKEEIRALVEKEINRRGQTCSIQASFDSGWMEFQEGRLVFRKCPMDELIANKKPD